MARYLKFLIPAIIFLLFPIITRDPYFLHIGIIMMLNSLLSITLMPLLMTGLFSIAHSSFMAVGAYASALMVMRLGLSFWLALVLAGVITAIFAAIIGFPILRIRGLWFMLVTFGLNQLVRLAIINFEGLTGGPDGLIGMPRPDSIPLFGGLKVEFISKVPYYYLMLSLLSLTVAIVYRLWTTKLGRVCRAIFEEDILAQSLGINLMRYKMAIFCIMCFFAGVGGAFYAHYYRFLGPVDFGLWASIMPLIYVQVGGIFSFFGPIIGACVLTAVAEMFRFAPMLQPVFFGILLIVTMLFAHEGMVGIPLRVGRIFKKAKGGEYGPS